MMELLLNLAWMLLALPAFWLWRRGSDARNERRLTSLQFLLALICVVVLLFPVISATDDLHAMRSEMEESAASRRTVRQASTDRLSSTIHRWQGAVILASCFPGQPAPVVAALETSSVSSSPWTLRVDVATVRGPPSSHLL